MRWIPVFDGLQAGFRPVRAQMDAASGENRTAAAFVHASPAASRQTRTTAGVVSGDWVLLTEVARLGTLQSGCDGLQAGFSEH